MPTAHIVHGFNVRNSGATTTDTLHDSLRARGYTVRPCNFGFRWLLGVRFGNGKRAQELASRIQPGDLLVGHSDGCNIITLACWLLAALEPKGRVNCVFFNPALDRDTKQSPVVSQALVFYTPSDRAVKVSRFLPFHPWGAMGAYGPDRDQRAVYSAAMYESLGLHNLGHSGIFQSPSRIKIAMRVFDDWIREIVDPF